MECEFREDKKNGKDFEYSETGTIIREANYEGGRLQGETIERFPNGKKRILETYKDGSKDGPVRESSRAHLEWTSPLQQRAKEHFLRSHRIDLDVITASLLEPTT